MKIAISATGTDLKAQVDERFGRAKFFVVYDVETGQCSSIDNATQLNAAQGAGIQTAQNLINAGVQAVITGNCGPKAYRTLSSASIEIYTGANGSVQEAIEAHKSGKLQKAGAPNVEAHW